MIRTTMRPIFKNISKVAIATMFCASTSLAQNYTPSTSTTINTCSGTFYDSGGNGGTYAVNQLYTVTFCPSTPGADMVLNFTSFNLENAFDFLTVYDGNSTAAPTLGTYTGTTSPGLVTASPTNASGCITFVFDSDGSINNAGWAATISCSTPCVAPIATITSTTPAASGGIIRICQGGTVNFSGSITGGPGGADTYAWNFGNGATSTQQNPTATFPNAGSYQVSLNGTEGGCPNTNSATTTVQVSTTPTITPSASPTSICLGQSANLSSTVAMTPFVPNCTPPVSGTTFLPDGSGVSYSTAINVNCYNATQTVTSVANIQNICLNMEHSYLGDLQITIICPNGQSMILKSYANGGNGTFLGGPYDGVNDATWGPGVGSTYCFTPSAGTLLTAGATQAAPGPTAGNSIVPGNYMPTQPFTNLIGCPLNGAWAIQVTDNLASDNGYIFNWDINFNVPPATGSFTPTIASQGWTATPGLTSTGATTATVTPTSTGSQCYTYSVTDNFGCTYSQVQCITVNPNTPVNAGPDVTICVGQSTTLTASGASTYSWSNGLGAGNPKIVSPASTTTYTVTGTSASGCVTTDQVTVTVVPPPTVTVSPNAAICSGASTNLTASGATTYSWSPTTGLSPTTGATVTASPTSTTTYTVTGTTAGCTNSATVTVTVNPLPIINAGVDQTVCQGTNVTLTASGGSTYTWNNGVTQGVAFTPSTTTTYTATGTSAAGCTNTDQVLVTVNPIPVVSAGPDVSICSGGSTTLTASGATTYSWSPGGQTTASITVSPASNTTYTVTGTSLGCTASDAVTVTVSGNAPINAGPDVSICAGASTTLTGTGGNTYSWAPGGQTTAAITVTPATTTTYTLTGTDGNGCIGSDQVVVTVNPLPIVNAGVDQIVCTGTSVTLTASGASTYSWNNGVTQGVAFTPAATTTYTVTGTTAAGCTSTDQVVVTINPLPTVNAGVDQTICIGASVTLTASGASTYSWNNGVNQGVAFAPAATTTYTVTGTSAAGCTNTDQVLVTVNPLPMVNAGLDQTVCSGTAVTLTATGASTYTWNNGVTQGVAFTPAATTTYTVTGTDGNGCTNTDQVVVTVNPLPTVNAGADQAICIGASATLAASGASTYSWNNGVTQGVAFTPAATTTFTVTGTSAAGCTNTDQVVVTVNPLPAISAGPDVSVCTGGSVTLTGTGGVAYSWNNGVNNGVPFVPASTTTYTVTGTDANGCINTDQITVSVLTNAPINAGPDVSICNGQSTTLTATGGVTYNWNNGLGTGNNFTVSPTGTTTYTVTGTDGNGCTGTDAITVTVNPLPTVNAGADQTVCFGTSVTLTGTGASTYTWDNGVTQGVAFTPSVGSVVYTVTGTTAAGCTGTDQVTVTVNPMPITNAGADQTICAGTSVTLTATGATTYSWNNGVNQGVAFTPASSTTYTVTGTTSGCTMTDQVTITVNPLPVVNAGADQTVCNGTSVTLTATGATTYTWDNGVTNGVPFTPFVGSITYNVTGTTAAGCTATDQVIVTVNPNPVPVIQGPTEYCSGNTATLSTSVAYAGFTWSTGATSATVNVTTANNPISVTVTNAFGCQATSSTFTVTENSVITANFTETICQGQSVVIHGVSQSVAGTYSQSFTSVSGCDSIANVTLVVNPLPGVNAGLDQTVCTPTSVTLTATGASTYVWNNGITQGTPFTQPVGSTTYTVTGTDVNGCINTDQVVVTVNPLPTVNAGVDQALCIGASATLSGSGASTYTWNNGVSNGVAFTPAATTTYTVTGTNANGCTNTDQVVVTVNPLPNVNAGIDLTTCVGGSVTLTASGAVNYSWNNGVTNGVAFSPASTATYTATGTDANGCINADQVVVTVAGLPNVSAGADITVCQGSTITLSGTGASSYTWNNGVTNAVAFTPAVGTTTYTVTGTDGGGCINTDQVIVTVNPLPSVNAGPDVSVCIGASATLSGSGAITYTWNNGVSNGVAFTPAATTTYTVTGTNANGCTNTDQVLVTVNPLPNVNAGTDQTICVGASVTLSGAGAVNYTWNNGVTNGVAFAPASTTTYTVTGTNANGCVNTDQVLVTVNPLPTVNAGPDVAVCVGQSVTLTGSGAATYSWSGGIQNGVAFTPAVTTTYTVTGTSAAGCTNTDQVTVTVNPLPNVNAGVDQAICIGASTALSGSGATTYTWNNGVTNGVAFAPIVTTTYTVTGTNANGCINTDQVVVTVNPRPNVNAGPDQTVCIGTSVTLTASGGTTYTWNNGVTQGIPFTPTSTATYTVTGTSAAGCTNTDQVVVSVNPLPVVNAGPDQTVCLGTVVTLSGSGAATYSWSGGIANGQAFTPAAGSITYTVTGTSAAGCINTDQVTVTVNPPPAVNAGLDVSVCEGEQVTLTATGAQNFSWTGGVTNGLTFTPAVGTTTYTVTGTDLNGCVNTDAVNVTVNPLPNVFAGNSVVVCEGQTVILTASGANSYTWTGGVSQGVGFIPAVGTSTYSVTGTSTAGCTNTDQLDVTVNPLPIVSFMPDITMGCVPQTVTLTNSTPNSQNCVWTISNGTTVSGCGAVPVTFNQGGCYDVTLTTTNTDGCTSSFTANNLICVEDYPNASFNPSETQVSTLNTEVFFENMTTGANVYNWTFGFDDVASTEENPLIVFPQDEGYYNVTLIAYSPFGCADTANTTIQVYEELIYYVPNTFTPDDDSFNPIFQPVFTSGFDPYDYSLYIFNRWGELIFESHDATVGWDGTYGSNGEIEMCQDGTYTWKIEFKVTRWDERKQALGHVNLLR